MGRRHLLLAGACRRRRESCVLRNGAAARRPARRGPGTPTRIGVHQHFALAELLRGASGAQGAGAHEADRLRYRRPSFDGAPQAAGLRTSGLTADELRAFERDNARAFLPKYA